MVFLLSPMQGIPRKKNPIAHIILSSQPRSRHQKPPHANIAHASVFGGRWPSVVHAAKQQPRHAGFFIAISFQSINSTACGSKVDEYK